MKEQFVPFGLSVELAKLGFDEPCMGVYKRDGSELSFLDSIDFGMKGRRNSKLDGYWYKTAAPLWQQAFDFMRATFDLVGTVYANASGYLFEIHHSANRGGSHQYVSGFMGPNDAGCWDDFAAARLACLEKLIELSKQNPIA